LIKLTGDGALVEIPGAITDRKLGAIIALSAQHCYFDSLAATMIVRSEWGV